MPVNHVTGRIYPVTPERHKKPEEEKFFLKQDISVEEDRVNLKKDNLKEISTIKGNLNEAIKLLKDHIKLNDLIERILENLMNINKAFPPYPYGSEEKVKILKSYIALRTLIERLTLPPERIKEAFEMTTIEAEKRSESVRLSLSQQRGSISEISYLSKF